MKSLKRVKVHFEKLLLEKIHLVDDYSELKWVTSFRKKKYVKETNMTVIE